MKFYLTFGQKYRREDHPIGGHPDGWFEVSASSYEMARQKVCALAGTQWANLLDENEFFDNHAMFYPRGKIGEI